MPKMTFMILFCFLLIYVCAHNSLITKDLKPIVRNGLYSSNRLHIFNSVIAPPKPGTKVAKPTKVEPPNPIFRENRGNVIFSACVKDIRMTQLNFPSN